MNLQKKNGKVAASEESSSDDDDSSDEESSLDKNSSSSEDLSSSTDHDDNTSSDEESSSDDDEDSSSDSDTSPDEDTSSDEDSSMANTKTEAVAQESRTSQKKEKGRKSSSIEDSDTESSDFDKKPAQKSSKKRSIESREISKGKKDKKKLRSTSRIDSSEESSDDSSDDTQGQKQEMGKVSVGAKCSSSSDSDESMDEIPGKQMSSNTRLGQDSLERNKAPKKKINTAEDVKAREVFTGGWPFGTREEEIRGVFEESCGPVLKVKVLGQGGAAFIEFETVDGAKSALEWNQTDYKGRKLSINMAGDKPQRRESGGVRTPEVPNSTIIVKNISFNATEKDFVRAFKNCGTVNSVRMPVFQDSGKPRGFAMVNFSTAEAALAATKLSGTEITGRNVTIEIAKARENTGNQSYQGGNNRGNARGGRHNSAPRNSDFQGKSTTFDDSD